MSITSVPTSGALYNILVSYLPRVTPEERQEVWDKYLQTAGFAENPDATPQVQASLSDYVRLVATKDLVIVPSYFTNTIQLIFGDNISTETTQQLWTKFMEEYDYVLPPDENNTEIKKQFIASLMKRYDELTEKIAVSPEEAIKRQLMFSVFDILAVLMRAFQDNVFVIQGLINFYSKHELEYTKQMSRIFFYKRGSPLEGVSATGIDSTNPEDFTLGYGSINIKEVISYVLTQQTDFNLGIHYTKFSDRPTITSELEQLFPELNHSPYLFQYEDPNLAVPPPPTPTDDRFFHINSPFYGDLVTVQFDKDDDIEKVIDQCSQAFLDAYNQNPNLTFTTTALKAAVATTVLSGPLDTGNTVVAGNGVQFHFAGGELLHMSGGDEISDFVVTNSVYGTPPTNEILRVSFNQPIPPAFPGDPGSPGDTVEEIVEKVMDAFENLFNTTPFPNLKNELLDPGRTIGGVYTGLPLQTMLNPNLNVNPFGLTNQFFIPWRLTADVDAANETRVTKNDLFHQYLEATRAKREAIADKREALEATLDSSQQAIRGFTSILDGSLKQLRTVIDRLFKTS